MVILHGTCDVYADGVRIADGSAGDSLLDPTALSGLTVSWGRDTTVDQPEASTCTFEVMDAVGGKTFAGQLKVGTKIDVRSVVNVTNQPGGAVDDPSFERTDYGPTYRTGIGQSSSIWHGAWSPIAHTGAQSYALRWDQAVVTAGTGISPAKLEPSAATGNLAAWSHLPTTATGQQWTVGAWIKGAPGVKVVFRPSMWTSPSTGTGAPAGSTLTVTCNGTWQYVQSPAYTIPAANAGKYVGVYYGFLNFLTSGTGLALWQTSHDTWGSAVGDWNSQVWDEFDIQSVLIDDIAVSPPPVTTESAYVFAGRITGLKNSWSDEVNAPVVQVSCADFTADLENADVGDVPWPIQFWPTRFSQVLQSAGYGSLVYRYSPTIPTSTQLIARDVDAQPALGLLAEIATSIDGVLWSATDSNLGSFFLIEDSGARLPLAKMSSAREFDACRILRDPIEWLQNTSDVSTRVSVTWTDDITDPAQPVQRLYQAVDTAGEAAYGKRRISISSQLRYLADAQRVGLSVLNRTRSLDWRAVGLSLDTGVLNRDPANTPPELSRLLLVLLHGTSRNGLPLRLVGLPEWTPTESTEVGVYVEGGRYSFEGGVWTLDLNVSNSPPYAVKNLIPNPMPNSATFWSVNTGSAPSTVTYPTTGAPGGTPWLKVTYGGTGSMPIGQTLVIPVNPANFFPVSAGRVYTASADVIYQRTNAYEGFVKFGLQMLFRDAAGTLIETQSPARAPGPSGQWYRIVQGFTAPTGAVTASIGLISTSHAYNIPNDFVGLANLTVNDEGSAWPFTGDTPDAVGLGYDWTGAANGSASTANYADGNPPAATITRRNLAKATRPASGQFATSGGNGTVSYSTTGGPVPGSWVRKTLSATLVATSIQMIGDAVAAVRIPVVVGKTYRAAASVIFTKPPVNRVALMGYWRNAAGTLLSTEYADLPYGSLVVGAWNRITAQFTAPVGATTFSLGSSIGVGPGWASGDYVGSGAYLFTDDLADTGAFFDGATPSTAWARYWLDALAAPASSTALYNGPTEFPTTLEG